MSSCHSQQIGWWYGCCRPWTSSSGYNLFSGCFWSHLKRTRGAGLSIFLCVLDQSKTKGSFWFSRFDVIWLWSHLDLVLPVGSEGQEASIVLLRVSLRDAQESPRFFLSDSVCLLVLEVSSQLCRMPFAGFLRLPSACLSACLSPCHSFMHS